jgi:signal transduction histidine kinase
MPIRLDRRSSFRNAAALFIIAAAVSVVGVYFTFDLYMNSLSRELMSNWVQSEALDIQERNLLTSITKNQRILLASQFITGVTLFDMSRDPARPLIEIGKTILPPESFPSGAGDIKVIDHGFFNKYAVYRTPSRTKMVLVFNVESVFLARFFLATVIALLFFVVVLFLSIKAVQRVEFRRREDFLKRALGDLMDSDQPSAFVERELPFVVKWWKEKKAESDAARLLAIENGSKIRLGDLAAQVAHDIGTPITTLQAILATDQGYDHGLINGELERMKALMDKMLRQYRGDRELEKSEHFDLIALLSTLAFEAEAIAKGRCEIVSKLPIQPIFVDGIKSDLSAALSNIIKNAVEAIDKETGRVSIEAEQRGNVVRISISDTGCGIPPDKLARVFEKDVSYKRGGTGLGLFQAKAAIEAVRGRIILRSTLGSGTEVEISLPAVPEEKPIFINIEAETHLVFLDDERTIHELWERILPEEVPFSCRHFLQSAREFRAWMAENKPKKVQFFIDHDFAKDGETGLALIEEFGIQERALLVTGRARDAAVQEAAKKWGVRIIDKAKLVLLLFRFSHADGIVLIDDSATNRTAWVIQAKRAGRGIKAFASEDFLKAEISIERATPIYVDYFLEGEARGGDVAERLIQMGFKNVYLTTEYRHDKIKAPAGISGIVNKAFPSFEASA